MGREGEGGGTGSGGEVRWEGKGREARRRRERGGTAGRRGWRKGKLADFERMLSVSVGSECSDKESAPEDPAWHGLQLAAGSLML